METSCIILITVMMGGIQIHQTAKMMAENGEDGSEHQTFQAQLLQIINFSYSE
ncbi:hypothetical protein ABES25_08390 [Bacillus gobiensis]|uniref:hypothetical protein n=1 Tax=Bacillus gobiensis TaxID=1441095 RepID=UPI003D222A4C